VPLLDSPKTGEKQPGVGQPWAWSSPLLPESIESAWAPEVDRKRPANKLIARERLRVRIDSASFNYMNANLLFPGEFGFIIHARGRECVGVLHRKRVRSFDANPPKASEGE